MNNKSLLGIILILISIPLIMLGFRCRESEQYNEWVVRQAQIAQSQGLEYKYTLRPVDGSSGGFFVIAAFFIIIGLVSLYQGQLYESFKKSM